MKKTVFLAVFILALAGMLSALNNEQVILSKKTELSGYAGFEVTRELVVTDNPKISIARDVAVHEYGSKIILKIKNIEEFERANIYIEQDFGELIGEGKDENGRHVDWEWNPVPSSVKWGVASHSYSRMDAGGEIEISFAITRKMSESEFLGIEKPRINADLLEAVITAPKEAQVGQRITVFLKNTAGMPVVKGEISIISPGGEITRMVTDAKGAVDFVAKTDGSYIYRAKGLKLLQDASTRVNPVVVSVIAAEISDEKKEGWLPQINLGDFAGIVGGLLLISFVLLVVAVIMSIRERGEDGESHAGSAGSAQAMWNTRLGETVIETKEAEGEAKMDELYKSYEEGEKEMEGTRSILEERRRKMSEGKEGETSDYENGEGGEGAGMTEEDEKDALEKEIEEKNVAGMLEEEDEMPEEKSLEKEEGEGRGKGKYESEAGGEEESGKEAGEGEVEGEIAKESQEEEKEISEKEEEEGGLTEEDLKKIYEELYKKGEESGRIMPVYGKEKEEAEETQVYEGGKGEEEEEGKAYEEEEGEEKAYEGEEKEEEKEDGKFEERKREIERILGRRVESTGISKARAGGQMKPAKGKKALKRAEAEKKGNAPDAKKRKEAVKKAIEKLERLAKRR